MSASNNSGMSESEAGEVSSSTDAAITSPSPDNEMVSSTQHHGDLAEAVNSITTSGGTPGFLKADNITLVTDAVQAENINHIAFTNDQQGAVSATVDSLCPDTQTSDYAIINTNTALGSQPGHMILTTDGIEGSEGHGGRNFIFFFFN